jgi:hypothetical protein
LAEVTGDDIERLASRLAMMVSEEGEAANAGRAVAQLARRLGLTGGELKEMFLYGATGTVPKPDVSAAAQADIERLEREIGILRKGQRLMEARYRDLETDRDMLARDLEALRRRAEVSRSSSQIRFVLLGMVALALAGAGTVGWLMAVSETPRPAPVAAGAGSMPVPGPAPPATSTRGVPDYGPVTRRVAVVKVGRAVAFREPDRNALAVVTLQSGMPVVVRRVFYVQQVQWAEVEVGSGVGYVLTADIDLS